MKLSHLTLISLLAIALFVGGASALLQTTTTDGAYTVIAWTNTSGVAGNDTWTPSTGVTRAEVLVIAGGGGSGGSIGGRGSGGGGAGGLVYNATKDVSTGSPFTVTVGDGGAGGAATPAVGTNGGDSIFSDITANGGGGGGIGSTSGGNGANGGSGGGNGGVAGSTAGTKTQANVGGTGYGNNATVKYASGYGGGGAGAGGTNTGGGYPTSALGGVGLSFNTSGNVITYAKGGDAYGSTGANAPANTGNGANYREQAGAGYKGGSGVVIIRYVNPVLTPVATFSSVNISVATNTTARGWKGLTPFTMQFTNTSTPAPQISWVWNYTALGNTTPVTFNQTAYYNPIYTFTSAGNYSIKLNATGATGSNISTQVTWINVSQPIPVVSFSTNVTSGYTPLPVSFTDSSTNSPTSWVWHFINVTGNNTITQFSTLQNPVQLFGVGNYTVNLTAINSGGAGYSGFTWINVSILYGAANSQFSSFNTIGTIPFTTYLYDTSMNMTPGPVIYYWDLGAGNISTAQNLYYTWNITGTYSVNHSMSNGLSTSWNNKSAYIVVGTSTHAPVAGFYGGPQIGAPPLTVYFTDISTNTPISWNWSFGDNTFGITQNPTHIYTGSGFKTVNLTATNSAGSNKTSQSNYVMVY